MPKKFYIADTHFSHANILHYDNRPFLTVEEMNRELITRWNQVVAPCDTVYILGDMFFCKMEESINILDSLSGEKVLIKGNHDKCNDSRFKSRFLQIEDYLEIDDNGNKIVLCHYPIPCFKSHYYGWYHFYGHVHNSFEYQMMEHDKKLMAELYGKPCNMYNVGAMMPYMNYTPRTFDEIARQYV